MHSVAKAVLFGTSLWERSYMGIFPIVWVLQEKEQMCRKIHMHVELRFVRGRASRPSCPKG